MWQLVLIAWGTKYGTDDINALVSAVRAQSRGPERVVLLTDRDRPGLAPGIETRPHPPEFLQPRMMSGGCQAKLAMFKPGLLPADMPAIFLDLDTVVMGDVSRLLTACPAPENVAILQSAVLPFGAFARWIWRRTGGRRYARGNSSVVVFHPAHTGHIAERFLDCLARHPDFGFRPMAADERFISWCAQPAMRAVPTSLAVKFPTEFMYPRLWIGRLRGALPEGAVVTDRKGRRMEWSDRYLGPVRQRLVALLAGGPPPGP